jgi:hypothetical protein
LSDGAGAGHALIGKERAIRPFRHGNFGVDVGAAFLIVALGKRPPMPYVWLPRWGPLVPERQGAFGALRCSARMVEVPNPSEFLG